MLRTINPATGQVLAEYSSHGPADVERCLASSWRAFESWREQPFAARATILENTAGLLEQRREQFGRLMTEEMGKPISQSLAEIDKCAWVCRHYAQHAAAYLAAEEIPTDSRRSLVRFDPLGPLLAVMPWNFPFWQVFRAAAPSLMAGNVVILKHASNVPGCALAIEDVFRAAGLPEGCFRTLLIGSGLVENIIDDPRVRAVTLTGSDVAGEHVASRAGQRLKKTVLELGGSDPFIVLPDADIALAARTAAGARLINSGQSCVCAKRFLVHEAAEKAFVETFVKHMSGARVGDPLDPSTEVGPLAREDLATALHRQVTSSAGQGALVRTGGYRLDRAGFFYAPTVVVRVKPGMPVADEETFGPAAAVISFKDEADAIRIANGSVFGLSAAIWTSDPAAAERLVARVEAGAVFVNGMVKSDPRLPFGGVKRSGYGRELGRDGIREFVNLKTVVYE